MSSEEVLVGVDPHKGHNALVVLDALSRRAVEEAEFANTHAGYREMVRFGRRWGQRRRAVEGCHGAGRFLAKLAARVRVSPRGMGERPTVTTPCRHLAVHLAGRQRGNAPVLGELANGRGMALPAPVGALCFLSGPSIP